MAPAKQWLQQHSLLVAGVLAGVVLFETFFLVQQSAAQKAGRTQTDKLLNTFLQADTAEVAGQGDLRIRLENVRFKWSSQVYVDAGNMAVRAVPLKGHVVDFDHLESFRLVMQQSTVNMSPGVLAGMFNESVFNYPGSKIRDLDVAIAPDDGPSGGNLVVLSGKARMLVWIPFKMYTRLSVDPKTNTLVIVVDHLKVLGGIPMTKLFKWTTMKLEDIITLPPNQSVIVHGNQIMVKPFGLFPPPRIDGKLASVKVEKDYVSLTFSGAAIPAPESTAKNYVYLRGGDARFGNFEMLDTDVLIVDRDPSDPFGFSLVQYMNLLRKSQIDVMDVRAVTVSMPDA